MNANPPALLRACRGSALSCCAVRLKLKPERMSIRDLHCLAWCLGMRACDLPPDFYRR